MKLETLNDKIIYAKGWNDAIRAAMAQYATWTTENPALVLSKLRELDRSMQATDD